ncbi:16S rRNA (cytidine(1402)-2'-O)-methyltransferase [Mycoplasmopsis alligatoris]|uniref:Ribosomal RNA small subunit methyltransferase I n=1 Tax=Mycoplasmopsis alligatoris A21JP2 TaxID=747682 RepID=D4XWN3_9BACT|nr:16S rRNA (cytidine(1402)-2'-O)-methyltransferase [Mycoplasmopsis alligatoris]EFF41201.1 S-adenosylmethionine-dependent methyltransferase, YraL family [Mycoplasmopsis alligatoris A21JP2]
MTKLFIVGTPIGNLEDITLRALRILKEVDVIACEDTRVTLKLLNHFEISGKKLITYNNFNEGNGAKGILKLIEENNLKVALVSDAGMPVVSDPGFELIRQAIKSNVKFELIPGVSASICAFTLSSFSNTFTFHGFIKDKTQQRINQLNSLDEQAHIFFVSPHKLLGTLEDIDSVFAQNADVFLGKELTKLHEEHYRGSAQELLNIFKEKDSIKGEFTMVLKTIKIKKNKYSKYSKNND